MKAIEWNKTIGFTGRIYILVAIFLVSCTPLLTKAQTNDSQCCEGAEIQPPANEDQLKKRKEAAKRYHEFYPPKQTVEFLIEERSALSDDTRKAAKDNIDTETLNKAVRDEMAKRFTTDEIERLVQCYGDSTGRSIKKKMPSFMQAITPDMMTIAEQAIKKAQEQTTK